MDPQSVPWARVLQAAAFRPLYLLGISRARAWAGAVVTLLTTTLTLLALPLAVIVLFVVSGMTAPENASEFGDPNVILAAKALSALLAILLTWALSRRWRIRPEEFGLTRRRLWLQILLIAPSFLSCYFVMIVSGALLMPFTGSEEEMMREAEKRIEFMRELTPPHPLQSLLLMLAVATHEEVLFRALLIPFLRRAGLGWFWAIVASSLLFGLAHVPAQGWLAMFQTGALGILFGTIFVLSRSLLTVIGAHALFNFVQVMILPIFAHFFEEFRDVLQTPDSQPGPRELPPNVV